MTISFSRQNLLNGVRDLVSQSVSGPVGQEKQFTKFKILHNVEVKCRSYNELDIQFGYGLKKIHTEFLPGNLLESKCLKHKNGNRRVTLSRILRKQIMGMTGDYKVAN
jgi:hypothetical protein